MTVHHSHGLCVPTTEITCGARSWQTVSLDQSDRLGKQGGHTLWMGRHLNQFLSEGQPPVESAVFHGEKEGEVAHGGCPVSHPLEQVGIDIHLELVRRVHRRGGRPRRLVVHHGEGAIRKLQQIIDRPEERVAGSRIGPAQALKIVAPDLQLPGIAEKPGLAINRGEHCRKRAGGAMRVEFGFQQTINGAIDCKRQRLWQLDAAAIDKPEAARAFREEIELPARQRDGAVNLD